MALDRDALFHLIFFILSVNELSICLQQNSEHHEIQGITLDPKLPIAPKIHALLFADDLIIYGQATREEASKVITF